MIESYMPTDDDTAEWAKERDRFVTQVMGPLAREGNMRPLDGRDEDA